MKAFASVLALLALALASQGAAHGQGYGRGGRRPEAPRMAAPAASPRGYGGRYPAPAPYPTPAYGGYARAPPPYPAAPRGYAAAPPQPGYRPNSLGADWGQQQDLARRGVRQGNMPLGSVIGMIRNRTPGRILDAGLEPGPDGRPAYRVRWAAKGGRRIDFIVDAATGQILQRNGY